MALAELLNIQRGLTAITGSGGKTTLLYALARELSAEARVIVCTTTHIYPPDGLPILWSPDREALQDAFHKGNTLCVSSGMERGKLLPPGTPFSVLTSCADFVLTEADGSHSLPAKAHAPHEPVIPPEAGQTICVFGLSALGRPILETVHRPQLCAQKLGVSESVLLTPELAAQLLVGACGQACARKNQPDTPLFSKCADRRLRRKRRVAAADDHECIAELRDLLCGLADREHCAGHHALRRVQPAKKVRAVRHVGPELHMRVKQILLPGQQIRQADAPPNIR